MFHGWKLSHTKSVIKFLCHVGVYTKTETFWLAEFVISRGVRIGLSYVALDPCMETDPCFIRNQYRLFDRFPSADKSGPNRKL